MGKTDLSLQDIRSALAAYPPRSVAGSGRMAQAAVAIVLREIVRRSPEVLMISRAVREGDPWSGHMGFPGGRLEPVDGSNEEAAVRETREELGLRLEKESRLVGRLSTLQARSREGLLPLCIHPFVFELTENEPELSPNEEVEEAMWIPVRFFAAPENRGRLSLSEPSGERVLPGYRFGRRTVWGLSLRMLDELVFEACGASFPV